MIEFNKIKKERGEKIEKTLFGRWFDRMLINN